MLWWEAVCAKAERKGQASCVLETENRLNRKAGLCSHGEEGMGEVGGLRDLILNLNNLSRVGSREGPGKDVSASACRTSESWTVPQQGPELVESGWSQRKAVFPEQSWTQQALTPTSTSHSVLS